MQQKLHIFIILALAFCKISYGQKELTGYYLESRDKADLVFHCLMENQKVKQIPYVLLSSGNSYYLVVLDRKTHFTIVSGNLMDNGNFNISGMKSKPKTDGLIKSAFDTKNYHEGFISWDSEFYKNGYDLASGAPTYFVMKDSEGNRFGESVLSTLVSPNPIDKKIYGYMVTELINSSE